MLILVLTLFLAGCQQTHSRPVRINAVQIQQAPNPVTVVIPDPTIQQTSSVQVVQPAVSSQWYKNVSTRCESGITVQIVADGPSKDVAGRCYWQSGPHTQDMYFVGLDARGMTVMVDWRSAGQTSGMLDGFRQDFERVAVWAFRPSQY